MGSDFSGGAPPVAFPYPARDEKQGRWNKAAVVTTNAHKATWECSQFVTEAQTASEFLSTSDLAHCSMTTSADAYLLFILSLPWGVKPLVKIDQIGAIPKLLPSLQYKIPSRVIKHGHGAMGPRKLDH